MHSTEFPNLPLPLIPRLTKCENLEAAVSLRVKQDEAKKRQHKALMEKADDISMEEGRGAMALETCETSAADGG
jgi:hypothetical protein